jgi:uncharacterized membrane protein
VDPIVHLALATLAFIVTHHVTSTPLRATLAQALGERTYLIAYSLVSFVTIGWMSWAYVRAPVVSLFQVPGWKVWPLVVMPLSFILLASGFGIRNPAKARVQLQLGEDEPARGIVRVTRHPVMWGIALWAAIHMVARADAAALIFFGGFLFVALAGTRLMDARKADRLGQDWRRFAAVTSNVPFAAIVARRNRFVPGEIGWRRVAAGIAVFGLFLAVHPFLFGARAF